MPLVLGTGTKKRAQSNVSPKGTAKNPAKPTLNGHAYRNETT